MAHQGLPSTGGVLLEVLRHWPRPTLFTNALPDKVIFWESESELVQPAKKLVIRKISFLCKTDSFQSELGPAAGPGPF